VQLKDILFYLYRNLKELRTIALLLFTFILLQSSAQSLKRVPISNSGCSVAVVCFPGRFDEYFTEDSSKIFADDCIKDDITYGIYLVKLVKPVTNLENAQDTAITYLNFMKLDYLINKAKGYDKGHLLNQNEKTRGIIDYWEDEEGNKWKVKAWTDGKFVGVLYVYGLSLLPENKIDPFLDGFLFTEK